MRVEEDPAFIACLLKYCTHFGLVQINPLPLLKRSHKINSLFFILFYFFCSGGALAQSSPCQIVLLVFACEPRFTPSPSSLADPFLLKTYYICMIVYMRAVLERCTAGTYSCEAGWRGGGFGGGHKFPSVASLGPRGADVWPFRAAAARLPLITTHSAGTTGCPSTRFKVTYSS